MPNAFAWWLVNPSHLNENSSTLQKFVIQIGSGHCRREHKTPTMTAALNQRLHAAARQGDVLLCQSALSEGASVHHKTFDGTALHDAAKGGHADVCALLIDAGAKLEAINKHTYTPLHLASRAANSQAALLLVAKGANVRALGREQSTPLHFAAKAGHIDLLGKLIKGASVAAKDIDGRTPLHWAAAHRQFEASVFLLEHGARLTATDGLERKPLHEAAVEGNLELCMLFIDRGAVIDAEDYYLGTPLHLAAMNGKTDVCEALIERGAHLNHQDKFGKTPLSAASGHGHFDTTMALLAKGADATVKDHSGHTPFDAANREMILDLVAHGVKVPLGQTDALGVTPRGAATERGHAHLLRDLLAGSPSDEPGDDLVSLARLAKKFKQPEVMAVIRSFEAQFAVDRVLGAHAISSLNPGS